MEEMKHDEKGMGAPHMHPHEMPMGPRSMIWQNNWKSPVAIGIFLATSLFGLVMLLYALNLAGAAIEAMKPAPAGQGMTQAEMQQLMQQQAPATSGAGASAGAGQ